MPGSLEEIFGLVVGIVSIAKDLGHLSDVLLASLCGHGHSIPPFRFSCLRTKKYALQGSYAGEKRGEGPLYFALFRLCETENASRECGALDFEENVEKANNVLYVPPLYP